MLSQRAVSGAKLLGIGSLSLVSLSGLFISSFLALMLWLPPVWAVQISKAILPGIPVANLDVFRIFYASAYQVIVPVILGFSGFSMGLSVYLGKRLQASPKKVAYVMLAVVMLSLMVFASLTPATMAISSTQTSEFNQFNTKPCSYYIFTDSTNYYAQSCDTGVITYGGPTNAGGATGTNAATVIQDALNGGGLISIGAGTYSLTAQINLPAKTSFIGVDEASVIISYTGSSDNTKDFIDFGAPGGTSNLANFRVESMTIKAGGATGLADVFNQGSATTYKVMNVTIRNVLMFAGQIFCVNGFYFNSLFDHLTCNGQSSQTGSDMDVALINSTISYALFNGPSTKAGLYCNGCQYSTIEYSVATGTKNGFQAVETTNGAMFDVTFLADQAINFKNIGFAFGPGSSGATPNAIKNIQCISCIADSNVAATNWLSVGGVTGAANHLNHFSWIGGLGNSPGGIFFGSDFGSDTNIILEGIQYYNPVGKITNPFDTTNNLIADPTQGNAATPTNSTTFTVIGSPKLVIFSQTATDSAGETTTIKIDGTAVPSINGAVLSSGFTFAVVLQPGQTYFATWHTGDASWLVSGE